MTQFMAATLAVLGWLTLLASGGYVVAVGASPAPQTETAADQIIATLGMWSLVFGLIGMLAGVTMIALATGLNALARIERKIAKTT